MDTAVAPSAPPAGPGPVMDLGLVEALKKQLGLKVSPAKAPLTFLIVDSAEKAREN